MHDCVAQFSHTNRQSLGLDVRLRRNVLKALGSVVHGVHGGHVGQQGLGGADVGGGLLTLDVLLTGLQGHPQGRIAVHVLGDADDPSGDDSLEAIDAGEESSMGAAVPKGHTKALGGPNSNLSTHLTRGLQGAQSKQIRGTHSQSLGCLRLSKEISVVIDGTRSVRILHSNTGIVTKIVQLLPITNNQLSTHTISTGLCNGNCLRVHAAVNEELVLLELGLCQSHTNGLTDSSGFVQK
mmetsp:Transcript_126480/g.219148  ORF Transcript_126480/g.219148 Transcript_126480/m.219148 type:complete len:238 (+) Transcript_126480:3168-3881(+)